ncbi:hypothetical protein [Spongiivirga citrea]|uniref:O-antigen ligase domain-containing protein n=1 Tax=Spongiivirga citrea TaxID=1481457 RepID=A0A6M0CPR2_9FLAO|nr:hypothetical protein [Spongiivirga citrea]NER18913.1 hypothetical protein [Spongiivirga citrea]
MMKVFYSILLFLICFVASTQLIAKYWSPYLYFDDILFLLSSIVCLIDLIFYNKFSRTNVAAAVLLFSFIGISFIFNFYSLNAFIAKLFYYFKPLFVFVFISYLANKYMLTRYKQYLYNFFILVCLFSIIEFYWVQYVDSNAIHYFSFSIRSGFYRASSVTWHPISLALLAFFSIIIGIEVLHDTRKWPYLIFITSVILSGTRFVMLLTALYFLYRYLQHRRLVIKNFNLHGKHIYVFLYPLIFFFILGLSTYLNVKDHSSLRSVTFRTGVPLLTDPKVVGLGTGIGSFGSYESVVNESAVYDKINFSEHYKGVMSGANKRSGTENFFFMALIEFGVIGLFLYFCVLLRITSLKVTYFFSFYVLVIICITFVYPINSLPFMYLVNIFFPYGKGIPIHKND